jgi:hypothetical protein
MKRYLKLEIDTHYLPFCCPKKYKQTINELMKEIKIILLDLEQEGKHEYHKLS